jgi:hypothetical protein
MEDDAEGFEVVNPGVEPYVGGGAVEEAVEDKVGAHEVVQELEEDVTDRACAAFLGSHGDEGAGESFAEVGLVGGGLVLRVDKVPPFEVFVFGEAPFGAAGGEDEEAGDEVGEFVRGDAERGEELEEESAEIAGALGPAGDGDDFRFAGAGEKHAGGFGEVIGDMCGAIRDAAHGVDDVFVEAGEEAEAVFAGEVAAALSAGARVGDAAGFAAEDGFAFVDLDEKAALGRQHRLRG